MVSDSITIPRKKGKQRRLLVSGCAVGIVMGLAYLTRTETLPSVVNVLDVGQSPQRADYVFIMMGDEETRPFVAAALLRQGYADTALFARFRPPAGWRTDVRPLPHTVIQSVLRSQGIAADRIQPLPDEAATTAEEMAALGRFLTAESHATVSIVTNDFHTRRTRWSLHRQWADVANRIHLVSAPLNGVRRDTWWSFERGFVFFTTELLKLTFYWLRFGYGVLWLGASLLAMVGIRRYVRRRRSRQHVGAG